MPAGLIHNKKAVAFAQSLTQMCKKQVHHGGVDPGQKEADFLAGYWVHCTVHIEILVARPYDDGWPLALARPASPCYRLKAKAPLVKEKNVGVRPGLEHLREFF